MSRIVQKMRLPALAGLLAVALVGSAALLPSHAADDAPPGGYPSWQDVQNAKKSEAGKAAEVARINGLLGGLQAEAETLGNAAVTSAAEYAKAEAALQAATSTVDALTAQTARAAAELGQYKKEIGALAAQSYKTGGTNMGFFVALDAVQNNSIQGLNIVQIVSDKTAALVNKSAGAERISRALADQEQAARAERERLSSEARTKLDAAQSAQQAMSRQIAEQQEHGQELTAQLASLKGTTAAVEGEFRQGQVALAAYETAQAAKRAAAQEQARQQAEAAAKAAALAAAQKPAPAPPAVPGVPAPPPVPSPTPVPPPVVVVPSVPGGAVNDPAGAKNYAAGQLGAYGWGQDQFPCLASLWTKESNWLTTATNPYSGAYGIAQSLPASKYASAGSDWLTSYRTQVNWGLSYIADRYGSPCGAWNHSVANNWY
ncbi:lytic transglycosylase domain-containing protein [Pseudarthrobacter sp. SSS035]|uniref:aggregation-promoting factor C-terminal-like domain-containing protein n=1 Tax=Pseudarthrobacter sp. SSS035 TaxID=2931399 RepID=UPI00200EF96E|nr:lytic transglycosylase domain-containing protein [Pseudarthrobacter sp. SSS035]